MNTKFDKTTPGVSEVILIVAMLLVEMKEAVSINDVATDILSATHPNMEEQYPVVQFKCNNLFTVLVSIDNNLKKYGVVVLSYPITSMPPFVTIDQDSIILERSVREAVIEVRKSWV